MKTRLPIVLASALLALLTFSAPAALPWPFLPTPIYTLTDLGVLPGCDASYGTALNLRGQAVGYCTDSLSGVEHAFLYQQGHLRDLGALVSPPDYYSPAESINLEGQVAGSSFPLSNPISGTTGSGFVYSPGRGLKTFMAPGCSYTAVDSINNIGQSVGYGFVGLGGLSGPVTAMRAFLRQPNGAITNLDLFGSTWAEARAINDWGQVVGSFMGPDGVNHGFLTQPGGSAPVNLSALGSGYDIQPYAINDLGQVVGEGTVPPDEVGAVQYSGGQIRYLGALPGYDYTAASGINNWSQVVGSSLNINENSAGWVYLHGQMHALTGLLSPAAQGWTVTDASGINDLGHIIGIATFENGTPHAVILTPRYW